MYCFISLAVYVHLHAWMDAAAVRTCTSSRGHLVSRRGCIAHRGRLARKRCETTVYGRRRSLSRSFFRLRICAHELPLGAKYLILRQKVFLHKAQPSGCAYTCLSGRRSQSGRPRPRAPWSGAWSRAARASRHATRDAHADARARGSARGNLSPNARQPQVPGDGVRLLHSCKLCQRRTRAGERRASLYR